MKTEKLYRKIASLLEAIKNCSEVNNTEWEAKHTAKLYELVSEYMPSGSGFDAGTQIDKDESNASKITFDTSFHHMDEHGGYTNWTCHKVIITPSFHGIDVRVTGRDKNQIKEYIAETFYTALTHDI